VGQRAGQLPAAAVSAPAWPPGEFVPPQLNRLPPLPDGVGNGAMGSIVNGTCDPRVASCLDPAGPGGAAALTPQFTELEIAQRVELLQGRLSGGPIGWIKEAIGYADRIDPLLTLPRGGMVADSGMIKALVRWQAAHGLEANGIVDVPTLELVVKALADAGREHDAVVMTAEYYHLALDLNAYTLHVDQELPDAAGTTVCADRSLLDPRAMALMGQTYQGRGKAFERPGSIFIDPRVVPRSGSPMVWGTFVQILQHEIYHSGHCTPVTEHMTPERIADLRAVEEFEAYEQMIFPANSDVPLLQDEARFLTLKEVLENYDRMTDEDRQKHAADHARVLEEAVIWYEEASRDGRLDPIVHVYSAVTGLRFYQLLAPDRQDVVAEQAARMRSLVAQARAAAHPARKPAPKPAPKPVKGLHPDESEPAPRP